MKMKNLRGSKFGLLRPVAPTGRNDRGNVLWLCQCDCGNKVTVRSPNLLCGDTRSCGCLKKLGNARIHNESHSHKTAEYKTWVNMKTRCYNPNSDSYPNYGGRGIKVYWKEYTEFLAYLLRTIGRKPVPSYSIDRIDVDGDYAPGNIRWATPLEQTHNRRKS